jgi:hypothetical protein
MASGGLRALVRPSPLEDDDGFGALPAQVDEPPSLHDGFEVAADDLRVRVVDQPGQDVALVDVQLVADGADLAHPHDAVAHDIHEKPRGEHAALDDEGDVPRQEPVLEGPGHDEREDAAVDGVHEAHAVGAPDAEACLPCNADKVRLKGLTVGAHLAKAAGFDRSEEHTSELQSLSRI